MDKQQTPESDRLYEIVAHWAAVQPEVDAWRHKDRRATYVEFLGQVRRFARALLAAGVKPGDRVAVLSGPGPEHWVSFIATASVGAIWVGLNPKYQKRELSYVLQDSKPHLLFGVASFEGRDFRGTLGSLAEESESIERCILIDEGQRDLEDFLKGGSKVTEQDLDQVIQSVDGRSGSLIVYTSGTTGDPKGAILSQSGLCRRFGRTAKELRPRPLRILSNLPINHVGGIGEHGCSPLMAGGTLVFQERFEPGAVLAAIEEHQITAVLQVPTMLRMLSEHDAFASTDWSSVELVIWGGGAMSADVIQRYRAVGVPLKGMFGLTEAATACTFTDDNASDEVLANTTGKPVAEYSVSLRKDDGSVAAVGEQGEVVLDNSDVWLGYFNRPEATHSAMTSDGRYRTGDVGILREDGNLMLIGRRQERYKSGGYNIYPREVELVLESHANIMAAVVVGKADVRFGEVGVAFVEVDQLCGLTPVDLSEWCHQEMANYKVPKEFVFVTEWPLLPNGKTDRSALKRRASGKSFKSN